MGGQIVRNMQIPPQAAGIAPEIIHGDQGPRPLVWVGLGGRHGAEMGDRIGNRAHGGASFLAEESNG